MANNLHGIVNLAYEDEDEEISVYSQRNDSTRTYCEDKRKTILKEYVVHDAPFKFYGTLYTSVREKSPKKWRVKCFDREPDMMPNFMAGSHTRKYSLVNPSKLTSGAVKLWVDLPEEVKFDPALAGFRLFYENENVSTSSTVDSSTQQTSDDASTAGIDDNVEDNTLNTGSSVKMKSKIGHFIKMCLLFACWLFFTVVFMMYDEMEVTVRSSSIGPGEVKSHVLKDIKCGMNLVLTLSGPFLTESGEKGINVSSRQENKLLEVWIDYSDENDLGSTDVLEHSKVRVEPWRIVLQNEDLDFREGEPRTAMFRFSSQDTVSNKSKAVILRIHTTSNQSIPFTMSYHLSQIDDTASILYAFLLVCGLYILIIFEVINRTIAAMLTSTASLAALALAGDRSSLVEMVTWLDQETLLLLFSMMLLVSILAETRIFDFLAVFAFEVTKGKIWPLITLLCAITATLSTVLDNVTTVLLMTPVTIRLCEVMDMDPIPVLVSMILYSNIGGAVTPVGDPPNVIIASNRAVIQAGINFINFTLHMALGIILIAIQTYLQLRFIYRDTNKLRINEPRNIQDLRHQISIWSRAAASLPHMSQDEQIVLETLEKKIQKLTDQLNCQGKPKERLPTRHV